MSQQYFDLDFDVGLESSYVLAFVCVFTSQNCRFSTQIWFNFVQIRQLLSFLSSFLSHRHHFLAPTLKILRHDFLM